MTYTADNFFETVLGGIGDINLFQGGTNYLVVLLIVFVSAILISPRKLSNIKVLALPLMVGYTIIGLKVPLLFLVLGGVVFVMEIMTTKGFGETIEAVSQRANELISIPEKIREKRVGRSEKDIAKAKRESEIRASKMKGLIPFRKGVSISDVMDLKEKERVDKILKMKSKTKRDDAIEKLYKRLEKKKYWEVDE